MSARAASRKVVKPSRPVSARRPILALIMVAVALAVLAAACAGASAPEVPAGASGVSDPVLVEGRDVFGRNCATCHGNEGQGGRGARINDGSVLDNYADAEEMVVVITDGKGSGMPAFGERLSARERLAVSRYIREILN